MADEMSDLRIAIEETLISGLGLSTGVLAKRVQATVVAFVSEGPIVEHATQLLAVVKAALPVLAPQKTDPKRGERALTELQSAANALHNALNGENS